MDTGVFGVSYVFSGELSNLIGSSLVPVGIVVVVCVFIWPGKVLLG